MRQCRSGQGIIGALPVETPLPRQKVANLVKMRFLFFGQAIKIGLLNASRRSKGLDNGGTSVFVRQYKNDFAFFGMPAATA
jgi:hypothetical protein